MQKAELKKQLDSLVNELPEDADWDALMYKTYVRQSIEEGLQDSNGGKTKPHKEIKNKYKPAR